MSTATSGNTSSSVFSSASPSNSTTAYASNLNKNPESSGRLSGTAQPSAGTIFGNSAQLDSGKVPASKQPNIAPVNNSSTENLLAAVFSDQDQAFFGSSQAAASSTGGNTSSANTANLSYSAFGPGKRGLEPSSDYPNKSQKSIFSTPLSGFIDPRNCFGFGPFDNHAYHLSSLLQEIEERMTGPLYKALYGEGQAASFRRKIGDAQMVASKKQSQARPSIFSLSPQVTWDWELAKQQLIYHQSCLNIWTAYQTRWEDRFKELKDLLKSKTGITSGERSKIEEELNAWVDSHVKSLVSELKTERTNFEKKEEEALELLHPHTEEDRVEKYRRAARLLKEI